MLKSKGNKTTLDAYLQEIKCMYTDIPHWHLYERLNSNQLLFSFLKWHQIVKYVGKEIIFSKPFICKEEKRKIPHWTNRYILRWTMFINFASECSKIHICAHHICIEKKG